MISINLGGYRRIKTRRAAVLGCGPTGMFVTHALIEAGYEVTIYSKKRRSEMYGAQYLHREIPGLTSGSMPLKYELIGGTAQEYRNKVYGDTLPAGMEVSPVTYFDVAPVHDIRAAYYKAWDMYQELIVDVQIDPDFMIQEFTNPESKRYWSRVYSSIPAPQLCYRPDAHTFQARKIWAVGDAFERGIFAPKVAGPGTVLCNASKDAGWYRASNVFGYATMEWPYAAKPPIQGVAEVVKPIAHNCNCFDELHGFWRVGRYGAWQKGYLTHHAYEKVRADL